MRSLALRGDANLLFTAPVSICLAGGQDAARQCARLESIGDVSLVADGWGRIFKGSLTFQDVRPADIVRFMVGGELCEEIAGLARRHAELAEVTAEVAGLAFADGSLSLSVNLSIPDGWGTSRSRLMAGFGPAGRDAFAADLRRVVLEWAEDGGLLAHRPQESSPDLPYFNLTYVGRVAEEQPGRSVIDTPELRALVYPRSPGPLESCSTLDEEYLYVGYAFLLLGIPPGSNTPEKLRDLLLILDVLYAQLAGAAASSKDFLAQGGAGAGVDDWERLERNLRMRYREIATPTFSFDHHVLAMRNVVLDAWGAADLLERSQELLAWGHELKTRAELAEQARRSRVFNVVLSIIAVLAVFDTADSVWTLLERLF